MFAYMPIPDNRGAECRVYHSCRNRHCPNCQTRAKEECSRRRMTELLPVPYAHLVFTLPHETVRDSTPLDSFIIGKGFWVGVGLMDAVYLALKESAGQSLFYRQDKMEESPGSIGQGAR
jgi:Transposase zinc-binding domain